MSLFKLFIITLLCILVTPILLFCMVCQLLLGNKDRALRMAIAIDQCGNALLGGSEDETISSHTGRAQLQGIYWATKVAPIIDFFFGKNHCRDSIGQ